MKFNKSNKVFFIILCFFTFLNVAEALAQDQAQVILLFQKRAAKFQKFFSAKPKFLGKESFKEEEPSKDFTLIPDFPTVKPSTGYIFYYYRFEACKISYDIQKSDSMTSPYMGYIFVDCGQSKSTKCGDFKIETMGKFFTTIELARQKRDDESCYEPISEGGKETRFLYKFIFAFQKKKWEFKDVVWEDVGLPDPILWTAFGKPSRGKLYVKDNDFWKRLID